MRSFFRRFVLLFRIRRYDHIFIHREASMIGPPFFEWFISKVLRRKFIYDFDDAIWLPNYSEANAKFQRLKMYRKVNKIMKWAHRINAGNEFLADYARGFNNNVHVIPTTIDTELVHNLPGNPDQDPIVIGWTGSHTTASYLTELLPIFDRLYNDYNFEFRVISNHLPDFERPYLRFVKWSRADEIKQLSCFNIGVMPLTDSKWARGKCGFKGLQYMALGIPALMSPVGVNTSIVQHGINGFLCANHEDWYYRLKELMEDPAKRNAIGEGGKMTVNDRFSVSAFEKEYLHMFQL